MSDTTDDRARFEEWVKTTKVDLRLLKFSNKSAGSKYVEPRTQKAWLAWQEAVRQERERDSLRAALEHIVEYWNRDENEKAMSNALWHILETAEDALKNLEANQQQP